MHETGNDMTLNGLWLQAGGCGGCSRSLLCADRPDFPGQLRSNRIEMLGHPALSLEGGHNLIDILENCLTGRVRGSAPPICRKAERNSR